MPPPLEESLSGSEAESAQTFASTHEEPQDISNVDCGNLASQYSHASNAARSRNSSTSSNKLGSSHNAADRLPSSQSITVALPESTLTEPRAIFQASKSSVHTTSERHALKILLNEDENSSTLPRPDFVEIELEDFVVYVDSTKHPNELRPLQHIAARERATAFYFDGTLVCGNRRFDLRRIQFCELPIGNYGKDDSTVGDQIWVRSLLNEKRNSQIFYKLKTPAIEYRRFYTPFLWVADLGKHVIDYCDHLRSQGRRATLDDFKSRFGIWIMRQHSGSTVFDRWYAAHGQTDFRTAVVANAEYIWKEAHGVDMDGHGQRHRLWQEIKTLDRYRPNLQITGSVRESSRRSPDDSASSYDKIQKNRSSQVTKTTVTPFVHDLFSHMAFGGILGRVEPSEHVRQKQSSYLQDVRRAQQIGRSVKRDSTDRSLFISSIRPGDVISTEADEVTPWKPDGNLWLGLVQKVHRDARGRVSFDVIWLYWPSDTPCGQMKYPWRHELFLSDNCTCHTSSKRVKAEEIASTHEVEWFGDQSSQSDFFVRQIYLADTHRWATLEEGDLDCISSRRHQVQEYKLGDTVLAAKASGASTLDVFFVEAVFDEGKKRFARVREFPQRRVADPSGAGAPPNELVYVHSPTDLFEMETRQINRQCFTRIFRGDEKIPSPYDRRGTGNFFYITHEQVVLDDGESHYVPITDLGHFGPLRQGFSPTARVPSAKLRGMDLFCGGGNFGRGLEDGGAIEMRWANDINNTAIHSYMANTKSNVCTPYLGSVDDLLQMALEGKSGIAQPGEVNFISAGSPCPGFSLLTNDRTTPEQRKNQSFIASFASYIDWYRPFYGLLENVPQVIESQKNGDNCVFSQLLCAIVGLGYQAQMIFLDAWTTGAPQTRSRVFLWFAAPGYRMPSPPMPTHSHPPNIKMAQLGHLANGEPFGKRMVEPTPFRYVSALEAIGDLPDTQDGKADYVVGYPDHRLSRGYTPLQRKQNAVIPIQPYGMNFSQAWHDKDLRVMSESERHLFPAPGKLVVGKNSKAWGRLYPHLPIPTITTMCSPYDAFVGRCGHWNQPRFLTILEARRAQGFLDHEVIVGSNLNQYKIVGNSVARQVALALGLAIREAWYETLLDEDPSTDCEPDQVVATKSSVLRSIEMAGQSTPVTISDTVSSLGQSEDILDDSSRAATGTPATLMTSSDSIVTDSETSRRKRKTRITAPSNLAKKVRL